MLVTLACPMKINLTLRVHERRQDGYHGVTSVYWRLRSPESVDVEDGVPRDEVVCLGQSIPGENIAARAIRLVRACGAEIRGGVRVTIRKALPAGSGVGGGSGDAAAVLDWHRLRGGERIGADEAASLGADVAFLSSGSELAIARERGELLEDAGGLPGLRAVVLFPDVPSGTAEAYRALDEARAAGRCEPISPDEADREARRVVEALRRGERSGLLPNDFLDVQPWDPSLRTEALSIFEQSGAIGQGLCGSGSALFGLYAVREDADRAMRELGRRESLGACRAMTVMP